jgi:hypothetical protein
MAGAKVQRLATTVIQTAVTVARRLALLRKDLPALAVVHPLTSVLFRLTIVPESYVAMVLLLAKRNATTATSWKTMGALPHV